MVGLNPTHMYIKDGIYYYGRKVPRDIEEHYLKPRIVMSLRTKSAHQASLSAASITAKLEAYWLSLRLSSMDFPAAHLLVSNADYQSNVITLSVAKDEYVKLKGEGRSKTFIMSAERNTNYVIACLGDRLLDHYTSTGGGYFRDWLKEKGLPTAPVRRILTTIKAIVGLAISEHGLANRYTKDFFKITIFASVRSNTVSPEESSNESKIRYLTYIHTQKFQPLCPT